MDGWVRIESVLLCSSRKDSSTLRLKEKVRTIEGVEGLL
jgi:hypothetical protein